MTATAKIFTTGNSQAVRLPKAFRMPGDAVWIYRDDATGDIILRAKKDDQRDRDLKELLQLIRDNQNTEEFLQPRDDAPRPSPFADWIEPASDEGAAS